MPRPDPRGQSGNASVGGVTGSANGGRPGRKSRREPNDSCKGSAGQEHHPYRPMYPANL